MTLAYLFFPSIAGTIIVLGLIFADGNPFRRSEVPMLEQLAELEANPDTDPEYYPDDAPTDDQIAWEIYLDKLYSGEISIDDELTEAAR